MKLSQQKKSKYSPPRDMHSTFKIFAALKIVSLYPDGKEEVTLPGSPTGTLEMLGEDKRGAGHCEYKRSSFSKTGQAHH